LRPTARQVQAEASDEAMPSKATATARDANVPFIFTLLSPQAVSHHSPAVRPNQGEDCLVELEPDGCSIGPGMVVRSPSGNACSIASSGSFGGRGLMTRFDRALTGIIAATSLLILAIDTTKAAGALAVGSCGAYGFAYDFG